MTTDSEEKFGRAARRALGPKGERWVAEDREPKVARAAPWPRVPGDLRSEAREIRKRNEWKIYVEGECGRGYGVSAIRKRSSEARRGR